MVEIRVVSSWQMLLLTFLQAPPQYQYLRRIWFTRRYPYRPQGAVWNAGRSIGLIRFTPHNPTSAAVAIDIRFDGTGSMAMWIFLRSMKQKLLDAKFL